MLQDVEVGKPLEIDGMSGVVIEQEEMNAVAPPALKTLYACVSLLIKKIRD
jgi:ketopantoate reductase